MGFAGKMERGLYVQPPYRGPVSPASLPTPPEMTFRMAELSEYDMLDHEEEWWSYLKQQAIWEGEIETASGAKEHIRIRIDPPQLAKWVNVRLPGVTGSVNVHSRSIKPIELRDVAGKTKVVAHPDSTPLKGNCVFVVNAITSDLEQNEDTLPTPEQIKQSKIDYIPYESGISFGTAVIAFGSQPPLSAFYRLKVGMPANRITIVAERKPGKNEEESTYFIIECEVAKGVSETFYIRGMLSVTCPSESFPDSLKRQFCAFQLTIGGSVPEVVTSPLGIRYAGLRQRSYSAYSQNLKLEAV